MQTNICEFSDRPTFPLIKINIGALTISIHRSFWVVEVVVGVARQVELRTPVWVAAQLVAAGRGLPFEPLECLLCHLGSLLAKGWTVLLSRSARELSWVG